MIRSMGKGYFSQQMVIFLKDNLKMVRYMGIALRLARMEKNMKGNG